MYKYTPNNLFPYVKGEDRERGISRIIFCLSIVNNNIKNQMLTVKECYFVTSVITLFINFLYFSSTNENVCETCRV